MLSFLTGWSLFGAINVPPAISIAWPRWGDAFSIGMVMKVKVTAGDPDGSISQVQFFVDTNLIAVATSDPFTILWQVGQGVPIQAGGPWMLSAVAIDTLGLATRSSLVKIFYS